MPTENPTPNKEIKVAIVAIAKDESAYLPEWIHHHLYFGFTGIFIGLNRTTDESDVVIKRIQQKFDNIYSYNLDWIDQGCLQNKNPKLQSIAYSYLTNCIREQDEGGYTHVLYIDIDELWFSNDFQLGIKDYIKSLPNFDMVSFNWLTQTGEPEPFSYPFKNLNCTPSHLLKSLISIESTKNVLQYKCHFPKMTLPQDSYKRIDSNGKPFTTGEHEEVSAKVPNINSRAFILHRAIRSEKEYIASLQRERPSSELPVKDNRDGYSSQSTASISINPVKLKDYWTSLDNMIQSCKINHLLEQARKRTYHLCDTILDVDPLVLWKHSGIYNRILEGTFLAPEVSRKLQQSKIELHEAIENIEPKTLAENSEFYLIELEGTSREYDILKKLQDNKNIILKHENGPVFHRCALFYQKRKKYVTAFEYINLALLCRPKGPAILNTFEELNKLVSRNRKQLSPLKLARLFQLLKS